MFFQTKKKSEQKIYTNYLTFIKSNTYERKIFIGTKKRSD